jgi:hypothetical protein
MGLPIDSEKRSFVAKLLEENEDFRQYVTQTMELRMLAGDESSKHFMETLMAEDEQEFILSLCQIGFIVYTDYLMATKNDFNQQKLH